MPESFASRLIAAYQAGADEKRRGVEAQQKAEEFKLAQQQKKLELDNIKFQAALHQREIQKLTSGGPTGQATTVTPSRTDVQIPSEGPAPFMSMSIPDLESGSREIGTPPVFPDIQSPYGTLPGTNKELTQAENMADLIRALKLKELEPFNLGEGAQRIVPSLTGGPPQVFENPKPRPNVDPNSPEVLAAKNRLAQILQQGQQAFTATENEKNRLAAMERAQVAARARLSSSGLPPATATRVGIIAQGFDNSPIVKAYNETQNRLTTTQQILAGNRTGPGDLAQVFEFMKGLDPTSVVRESEYATAAKSGNIFAGWAAKFNGYLKPEGGFLPENVRQEFLKLLQQKLAASQQQVDNLRREQASKINKWTGKTDGEEYLTDFTGGGSTPPPVQTGIGPNGNIWSKDATGWHDTGKKPQ